LNDIQIMPLCISSINRGKCSTGDELSGLRILLG
jgi:hypothetical protein